MVNKIFSATFALAFLLLTQVAHAQHEGRAQDQNGDSPQVQNSDSTHHQGANRPIPLSSSHNNRAFHAQHEGRAQVQNTAPDTSPNQKNTGGNDPQHTTQMSPSHNGRSSHAQHEGRGQVRNQNIAPMANPNQPKNTGNDPQHTTQMSPSHGGRSSSPLRATHNTMYDDPEGSMDTVACSNGENGLGTKYKTFGSIPSYPFIGGVYYDIPGSSSPNCGSCWIITNPATGLSIQMTSIDSSDVGFDLTTQAFSDLTNGDLTVQEIDVVAKKLSASPCSY